MDYEKYDEPNFLSTYKVLVDVEGDGHGPQETVGKMSINHDPKSLCVENGESRNTPSSRLLVVFLLAHEATERREATVQQHLNVAELTRSEIP